MDHAQPKCNGEKGVGASPEMPDTPPKLLDLLAMAAKHEMTPEERHAQRRSWVIGQIGCSHPEMTRPELEALVDRALGEATPAQPAGAVPDSLRAPDDLTREQIRGRAKALLVKNGWKPGDNFTTQNVVELIATIGMSLLTDPPQDRCAYPECGCDADSVCGSALASHPAGQSDDGTERCIACSEPLKTGERVLSDASGGTIHAACCGPERESYTGADGAPLGPNDPIPQGYAYEPAADSTRTGDEGTENWRDDPSADERWCAGVDYAQEQLCHVLGIAPDSVSWDAATETLGGDIQAVICGILAAWAGDDWQDKAARPAAPEAQGAWMPISTAPRNDTLVMLGWWCDVGGDLRWIAVAGWYEAGPADQCWYAAYDEERIEPTHWQPLGRLPAPPASSGQ